MSAPIANGWPSKAEFTQQVLVAGQVSIRMKFAKTFSSLRVRSLHSYVFFKKFTY